MKVAVFVEGNTEAAITKYCLMAVHPTDDLKVDVTALSRGSGSAKVTWPHNPSAVNPTHDYTIFVCPGDGSVFTSAVERSERLFFGGTDRIVGVQDIYGSRYDGIVKRPIVDNDAIDALQEGARETGGKYDPAGRILLSYSVMEVESWFIGMPGLLQQYDSNITPELVESIIGSQSDILERTIYHPAGTLGGIFAQAGRPAYKKTYSQVEGLSANITDDKILKLVESGDCPSFEKYLEHLGAI